MSDKSNCHYNYANKCDCSEDDKCGCDYPNNIPHDFNLDCLSPKQSEDVATSAPMTTSAFDDEASKPAQKEIDRKKAES